MKLAKKLLLMGGGATNYPPSATIETVSSTASVASMRITWSEQVSGFEVGDITISAGGSLANFATADNIIFTVDWTLAVGANTLDINAAVCTDLAGLDNTAASQYGITKALFSPSEDTHISIEAPDTNYSTQVNVEVRPQAGVNFRGLMIYDLSTLATKTILAASQKLVVVGAAAQTGHNIMIHRILAANSGWPGSGVTWNYKIPSSSRWAGDAAQNGGTDAGCTASGTDYSATPLASFVYTTNSVGDVYNVNFDLSEFASMIGANNGAWVTSDLTNGRAISFGSQNNVTAGNRPVLTVVYVDP